MDDGGHIGCGDVTALCEDGDHVGERDPTCPTCSGRSRRLRKRRFQMVRRSEASKTAMPVPSGPVQSAACPDCTVAPRRLVEQPDGVGRRVFGLLQDQRQHKPCGGRADRAAEQLFGEVDEGHVGRAVIRELAAGRLFVGAERTLHALIAEITGDSRLEVADRDTRFPAPDGKLERGCRLMKIADWMRSTGRGLRLSEPTMKASVLISRLKIVAFTSASAYCGSNIERPGSRKPSTLDAIQE